MRAKLALVLFAAVLIGLAGCGQETPLAPLNVLSVVSVGEVNGVPGQYCTTLYAGQDIDAGTVCVEVIDNGDTEEFCATYTTTGGWELVETHFWLGEDLADMPQTRKGNPKVGNFPYHSGDITGQTTYTVCVDLNQFGTEGGADDLCDLLLYAAAHAVVRKDNGDGTYQTETGWGDGTRMVTRGNWATYFTVLLTCEPGGGGGGRTGETAFAADCGDYDNCFLDIPDEDGSSFNRWGWSNGPLGAGTYYFDIYAGAGQCDRSKGTLVGLLTVDFDGSTAVVTYNTCGEYTMDEVHLYVGNEILARDVNNEYTVAPGQYPYIDDDIDTNSYTFTVDGLAGDIYVVAHAVVVGDYTAGDCGTRGCVPPEPPCDPTEITTLYGTIDGYLVTIDPATGDATEVAPYDFTGSDVAVVFDLAFDATTGKLYGLGRFSVGNTPALVEIDPCTAGVTLVGAVTVDGGTVFFGEGFAIDPDGNAYASLSLNGDVPGGDYYSETLATLDLGTAVATVVGTIDPTVQHEADALEFVGYTLYAGDDPGQGPTSIYTLDTLTAAATLVGSLGSPRINNVTDMAYNPVSGLLYGHDPGVYSNIYSRYLCTISHPGTAAATPIGVIHSTSEFGGGTVSGLAWASRCCE
jgi:hypothetical protein